MFILSDNSDTLTGMRLAGIEGFLIHNANELEMAIKHSLKDNNTAILMVNERLAAKFPESINQLKQSESIPLIVEIPDRSGSIRGADFITRYIKEAIGVKL